MQQYWLRRNGGSKLVIFALGWGCDHRCVEHIEINNSFDILTTYDYRTIEPINRDELVKYHEIRLFAWSFGVWAAEPMLAGTKLHDAVAFNGTPHPVDSRWGIDPKRMAITIRGFERNGIDEFLKRTYEDNYKTTNERFTDRTIEQNIEELRNLALMSEVEYEPSIAWRKAIIGSRDVIFPPKNMAAYWGIRAQIVPLPHYPFGDPQIIIDEIENR